MDKLKMIIADPSEDFRTALSDALMGRYSIELCQNGFDTLNAMRTFLPDILVLDLMIPGMDGISLLQEASDSGLQPMALVTTRYVSDYILDALERLGVAYLMTKPCDIKSTVNRISDMSQRLQDTFSIHPDPRATVSGILLSLNIPTKLHGYGYLREAIVLKAADPRQSVTKELYPAVAEHCGGNAAQVERSIRGAISAGWQHQDELSWRQYFSANEQGVIPRPTNSAFISRLADALIYSGGLEVSE